MSITESIVHPAPAPAPAATATATVSADVAPLFEPLRINGLTLDNRIVMAPMTRTSSPDGVPGPQVARYYASRAENGVGLVITEGTLVGHPSNAAPAGTPYFHGEAALEGWANVVREVHRAGGRIIPQLWHVGVYTDDGYVPAPPARSFGPSGLDLHGEPVAAPMTDAEIADIVEAHARAAAEAQRLGFDGVEVHAAHGFLLDQFLWRNTNRRADRYGGAPAGRARLAAEVVAAVRRAVGPHFPILLRLSQWKMTDYTARNATGPGEYEQLLAPLVDAGVDVFDLSTRRFWLPAFADSPLSLAGWTRRLTGRPTVAVGSVGLSASDFQDAFEGRGAEPSSLARVLECFERGDFDLVAVGRALLSDPRWAAKVRDGRTAELRPFDPAALRTLVS